MVKLPFTSLFIVELNRFMRDVRVLAGQRQP